MSKIGQYHLKALHQDAFKLIRHIRTLVNMGALKKISHESVEGSYTWVCIMLRDRVSLKKFDLIQKDLESLGLKMI